MSEPGFSNPGPAGDLHCMLYMFPNSNTPDLNDQLIIELCWSLITTRSFESGVLGQGAQKHWNKPRQSFIEVAHDTDREIYFLGEVRVGEKCSVAHVVR